MNVSKEDIQKLTIPELKSIYKNIKEKLGLQVMGKKKGEMVEQLFKLHDNSVIRGKKLFSFDNSGHIKIPMSKKTKAKPEAKQPDPKPEPKKEEPKPKPKKEEPKPKPKPQPKKEEPKPEPKPEPKKEEDCLAKRSGQPTKPTSRKDFFKQSMKFHPDKNPDCIDYATEMFKKLNNLNAGKDEKGSENTMTQDEKDFKAYFTKEVFKDIKFNFKISEEKSKEPTFIFTIKESKEVQQNIKTKLLMIRFKVFRNSFKMELRNKKK